MKNRGSISKIILFSIFVLLLLNSLAPIGFSNETFNSNVNIEKNSTCKNHLIKMNLQSKHITKSIIKKNCEKIQNFDLNNLENSDNIIVADTQDNESYPSMIFKGEMGLVAYEYKDENDPFIYVKKTKNYGQTWIDEYKIVADVGEISDVTIDSPNIDCHPGLNNKHVYGTFKSNYNNSGAFGYFESPDFSKISDGNLEINTFDWSYFYNETIQGYFSFWGFKTPNIIHYNSSVTPWVISTIGSTNYTNLSSGEGPTNNSIMFCFNDLENPDKYITLAWFPEINNCSNLSIVNEYDYENIYGIAEVKENEKSSILFFRGNPNDWYYGDVLFNKTLEYSEENLYHPSIYVRNENVYITAETDDNGIVLFKSQNQGNTWTSLPVTEDILDENATPIFPNIIGNDTHLICSFVESGNLSITNSGDDGNIWDLPDRINNINGSVVGQTNFIDFPDKNHIVWTDDREDNYDLFTTIRGFPEVDISIDPESVALVTEGINIIPTKNIVLYTIANNGGYPVVNIQIVISAEYDEKLNKSALPIGLPLTIDFLDTGDKLPLEKPLFRLDLVEFIQSLINLAGIKYVNISATLKGHYIDNNPENNNYKLQVCYNEIFPKLKKLENLFLLIG